jgi:hypothetical protein
MKKVVTLGGVVYSRAAQKLFELAIVNEFLHIGRAVQVVIACYSGVKRDNGQDEADHSISVAWSLWNRRIHREVDIVKGLLHDLIESGKKSLEYVRENFNDEIADDVDRLTRRNGGKGQLSDSAVEEAFNFISGYYIKMKQDWSCRKNLTENRKKLLKILPKKYKFVVGAYYDRIAESPICVVIKNYDKCDIFGNMSHTLPIRNQKIQIIEYEAFLALRCKAVRKSHEEYRDLLFGGRNEAETLIENSIHHIKSIDKAQRLEDEVQRLNKLLRRKK